MRFSTRWIISLMLLATPLTAQVQQQGDTKPVSPIVPKSTPTGWYVRSRTDSVRVERDSFGAGCPRQRVCAYYKASLNARRDTFLINTSVWDVDADHPVDGFTLALLSGRKPRYFIQEDVGWLTIRSDVPPKVVVIDTGRARSEKPIPVHKEERKKEVTKPAPPPKVPEENTDAMIDRLANKLNERTAITEKKSETREVREEKGRSWAPWVAGGVATAVAVACGIWCRAPHVTATGTATACAGGTCTSHMLMPAPKVFSGVQLGFQRTW